LIIEAKSGDCLFDIILRYLPGLLATEIAGVKFATGAKGDI
jgi:hypothetical protein